MDLANQSTIHAPYSVINNTINKYHVSSSSGRETNPISEKEAEVRGQVSRDAVRGASFDAAERGEPPKCHPDTRLAIQDLLAAWRGNPRTGPVRLISGWAGTGKTTIAQTMSEYWAKQGQLAGSFFFSRSSNDRNTTDWFPETILHQFLQICDTRIEGCVRNGFNLYSLQWANVVEALSLSFPLSPSMVIVIDGLDEGRLEQEQKELLRGILVSIDRLGTSIKVLISCRPERHLEAILEDFAPKLGPFYRIQLGQAPEDNDDIRTFLRVSFDRICHDRRKDGTMSIMDGIWPSDGQIEELVDRASGQFIFAATVLKFVGDEEEDPVKLLKLVLERRTSSFRPIDTLYLVILERVSGATSPHHHHLVHNLLLHVNYEPSSSADIADFWFEELVDINIRVRHLRALLTRHDAHGQDSQEAPIQFRHKSFHDFLARPSVPHPFSLAEMNPVSKFFFFLRRMARAVPSHEDIFKLRGSQQLAYAFLCFDDHLPVVVSCREEARRLHQEHIQDRPAFRGCICLPKLESVMVDLRAVRTFKSCAADDCVVNSDLLRLCRMIETPVDYVIRGWKEHECGRPISFRILKLFLWLRTMLAGLFEPLLAIEGITRALISRPSSLGLLARCTAVTNAFLCILLLVNTRCDVVLLLYGTYFVAGSLLHRFLRFDMLAESESPDTPIDTTM
ncbi:hypothetical protein BDN72DRAFT_436655 [Pluteus cervinus]|uniref:Uncharacterized protein n=1 Tax=Pluteus cervinus TaxID=181527 RepID=A0ACD3B1L6_9AGAR|nr:hypothetical protein BDN72DRAFT_436655 [Pluteus cervinus]